jgi:probable DNA repair protein
MDDRIFAALCAGVPVITASRRLARALRYQFNELQNARGATAWESPLILPWTAWLDALWEEFQFTVTNPPARLDRWQEWALWDRIVRRSPQAAEMLQVGAVAATVQNSWALAIEWRLDLPRIEREGNEDALAFTQWARQFAEACESQGWIDAARVSDRLREGLAGLRLPARVLLAGFDELTPHQTDFIEACRQEGCEVEKVVVWPAPEVATVVRAPFPDRDQELIAAARWARKLLEANPREAIGVIVSDLAVRRAAVERVFRTVLEPGSQLPGGAPISRLVNFSAGQPLADYPIVGSALGVLRLSKDHNDWHDISVLVRDGYIAGAETERTARGLLDARLRESGRTQFSLADVRDQARTTCPALSRALRNWLKANDVLPARQTAAPWAATFSAMLEAVGWPGEQPLNSVEYQTVEAWKKALSAFAGIDSAAGEMAAAEALSLLTRVAGGTDFQPESPDAPVQVLGTLEAFGLRFDHLWVVGLDDESWPKAASPDPFLPIRLQREAGVPRCSPERELAFATLVTQRLLASAADTVLSYPIREDDRDLSPSPLILSVPKVAPADLPHSENATCMDAIRQARAVEQVVDEQGPPLGQEAWQRGGSRVFQYQAACPFRAFVELRLGAEDLEAPAPGLDARQRGTLVHAALEGFWNEVRTYDALCNRPDIADVVRQAVAKAVERFETDRGAPLLERFAALERRRLERIVSDWLELEKLREPFEVIKPEGERDAEVGGIHFRVKIDRIDRIAGERDVIIDYKTGTPSVRSWETERPEEPQLPLYSVVYGERPLAGVLFGQLKTGEVKFKGLVGEAVVIPGADSGDLAARIVEWRRVMERLAADFRAGHAEADPKEPAQSCRYCSLACLCRIAECDAYWNLEAE